MDDPLGVLRTTAPILKTGVVVIDHTAITVAAGTIPPEDVAHTAKSKFFFDGWTLEEKISIVLIFNAINFSFWPDHGEPRWTVRDSSGGLLDGSFAAYFCLENAVFLGWINPLRFPDLCQLDQEQLALIFRGRENSKIPLLPQRLACLGELGRGVPIQGSEGVQELLTTVGSAEGLVRHLISQVPNFNDGAEMGYFGDGETVRFYKRAQFAASMIHRILVEEGRKGFADIGILTAFSDYRIPQVLREMGILVYDEGLAKMVDSEEELPLNSIGEVCIRAATIWGAEYLRQKLEKTLGQPITATQVDYVLWRKARELKDSMRPHHRTRTTAY